MDPSYDGNVQIFRFVLPSGPGDWKILRNILLLILEFFIIRARVSYVMIITPPSSSHLFARCSLPACPEDEKSKSLIRGRFTIHFENSAFQFSRVFTGTVSKIRLIIRADDFSIIFGWVSNVWIRATTEGCGAVDEN